MPGLLNDHIAVVTGAGSGIGRAIAVGFRGARASPRSMSMVTALAIQWRRSARPAVLRKRSPSTSPIGQHAMLWLPRCPA
jgi:hypothetical protein